MEKKFTRAMVCEEFKSTCGKCPLHSGNNPKSLPCWLLDESAVQEIMKDYPYVDVKVRMIFNDIETRLAAVEKKVENKDEPKVSKGSVTCVLKNNRIAEFEPERIIFGDYSVDVIDKKLYDKLEEKHEADCRIISEYDLEIKKLEKTCNYLYVELNTEQKEHLKCEDIIKDLKFDVEKANDWVKDWEKRYKELEYMYEKKDAECNGLEDRYRRHNASLKSRLFDLKNVENERDHYKGLYSSMCDDYDRLLEKQLKTEKELEKEIRVRNNYRTLYDESLKAETKSDHYKELFHSLNHKHQKVVGEMKAWKERAIEAEKKLKETEEKYNDACVLNKLREDVFEANLKLKKTIEAKDREIDLLRAELDKYKTDECDDRWID